MPRRRALAVFVVVAISVFGTPSEPAAHGAPSVRLGDDPGRVLAVVGRQAAWLDLLAPRPQILTQLQAPTYAADVATLSGMSSAVVAVVEAFNGRAALGGDLVRLDLATHTLSSLVPRVSIEESLGAPAWMPDGSRLFFDRADLTATPIQYPGQAYTVYPSRVEVVQSDGTGRGVVVSAARMPTVSPDGTQLAYLRSSADGTALLTRPIGGGDEQVLVPATRFANLAYPRFAPLGNRIAFMVPGAFIAEAGEPTPEAGKTTLRGLRSRRSP